MYTLVFLCISLPDDGLQKRQKHAAAIIHNKDIFMLDERKYKYFLKNLKNRVQVPCYIVVTYSHNVFHRTIFTKRRHLRQPTPGYTYAANARLCYKAKAPCIYLGLKYVLLRILLFYIKIITFFIQTPCLGSVIWLSNFASIGYEADPEQQTYRLPVQTSPHPRSLIRSHKRTNTTKF